MISIITGMSRKSTRKFEIKRLGRKIKFDRI